MLTNNPAFTCISSWFALIAAINFGCLSILPNTLMFIFEGNSNFFSGVPIRATFVSIILSLPYLVNHYYLPTKTYLCKLLSRS